MARICDLPTELVIEILGSCPDIQSVLRLAATNRFLQQAWRENTGQITAAVLAHRSDAVQFAKAEAFLTSEHPREPDQISITEIHIRHWYPVFVRHERWAEVVAVEYMSQYPESTIPASKFYYIFRQLALFHDHPEHLPIVAQALCSLSGEAQQALRDVASVMTPTWPSDFYDTAFEMGVIAVPSDYYDPKDPVWNGNVEPMDKPYYFAAQVSTVAVKVSQDVLDDALGLELRHRDLHYLAHQYGKERVRAIYGAALDWLDDPDVPEDFFAVGYVDYWKFIG